MRRWTGNEIRDRIALMFGVVHRSLRDPLARTLAVQMVLQAGCPSQQLDDVAKVEIDACQVAAVYWGCKNNGYYMGDVFGVDTYQTVRRTAALGSPTILGEALGRLQGFQAQAFVAGQLAMLGGALPPGTKFVYDCDDATILLCSLLGSIGFRMGAKVYSDDGRHFGHVVAVTEIPRYAAGPKQIVPMDLTEAPAFPGWEPGPEHQRATRIYWYVEQGA